MVKTIFFRLLPSDSINHCVFANKKLELLDQILGALHKISRLIFQRFRDAARSGCAALRTVSRLCLRNPPHELGSTARPLAKQVLFPLVFIEVRAGPQQAFGELSRGSLDLRNATGRQRHRCVDACLAVVLVAITALGPVSRGR